MTGSRFQNLADCNSSLSPAECQQQASDRFADTVRDSALTLFDPELPVDESTTRIIIGVAPAWNQFDRILLDLIDAKLTTDPRDDMSVEVFDTDICQSPEELGRCIPGAETATAWPMLGASNGGILSEMSWGLEARDRILKLLDIPPEAFSDLIEHSQMAVSDTV